MLWSVDPTHKYNRAKKQWLKQKYLMKMMNTRTFLIPLFRLPREKDTLFEAIPQDSEKLFV